eukprot:Nitzschia sp. Nitz4//scaffold4_size323378//146367//147413//NITZ4_000660-RA/size323378-processed-gene-0.352-mRNA-1//-1//CDS//3329553399//2321//frame0
MPPAAKFDFATAPSVEEPYDGVADVGGIEVEANVWQPGPVVTHIRLLPRDHYGEESAQKQLESDRFGYLSGARDRCLVDSFDSIDEIEENSNEARLIHSIAASAGLALSTQEMENLVPAEELEIGYIDATEAQYLDVLDQHLEDTDPECSSFADLDSTPDDTHPNKNRAHMDKLMEDLLDNPCCQCADEVVKPLRSALRPSKWTAPVTSSPSLLPASSAPRSVKFKDVDIREFNMTLGNHPSATSGPPVMLDWESQPAPSVLDLESYEKGRQPRRNRRQLRLSLQQRHNILVKERGFSFQEVKGAWQEALEIRKQRKETLERGLAMMKWDEVWESTCRKFSRVVDGAL